MAGEGYSGTPLLKKLGIKPEMKILLLNPPHDYFELLEADITDQFFLKVNTPDFIHLFAKNLTAFKAGMKKVLPLCKTNSSIIIWVSWYKKSTGIITDLTEDMIRDYALQNDLVDIKVCAVSNEWSGLKLVVPVAKR